MQPLTETCANIGNVLWNWRMLQITADAKYADIMEQALYNSVLSGISLEGTAFCYNNPLQVSKDLPFKQRWNKEREGYITLSNCCAPNVTRTIAEVSNYGYSFSKEGIYINFYGSNILNTVTPNGEKIQLEQITNYPWDGKITIKILQAPKHDVAFFLRIPGWSQGAQIAVNQIGLTNSIVSGTYAKVEKQWKKGDTIELTLPMNVELMQANPLVEETKNQVAVKRGPIIYCLESNQLPPLVGINEVALDTKAPTFEVKAMRLGNREVMSIQTDVVFDASGSFKDGTLYKPLSTKKTQRCTVKLIPYFAWGNKGKGEMTVWLPY
jgi:DUF1680 family protein